VAGLFQWLDLSAMTLLRTTVFFMALAIPWLSPFTLGPSAGMVPWLVSLGCVGVALLAVPRKLIFASTASGVTATTVARMPAMATPAGGLLSLSLLGFLLLNALYFAAHMLWTGAGMEALAVLLAWGCVGLMAWVGAALVQGGIGGSLGMGTGVAAGNDVLTDAGAEPNAVRGLACMWLVVALVSCGLALLQYLSLEQWFAPWISASSDGTAYANLRQRNQFATLCSMGLVALLYLCQTGPVRAGQAWPWAAAAVLAMGTALSCSRTGALQWLLIAGAMLLCWRRSVHSRVRWLCVGALGLYGLAVLVMPWFAHWVGNPATGLWGRAQEAGEAGGSRLALYSNVLDLIGQKPWLGWGWRELAYAHYCGVFDVRFVELLDNAHNLPLHLAVELGVPYALLFCGAIAWWVLRSAPWAEVHPTRQLAWAVLLLLGVHSMVEYPLWYGPFIMTLGLCLGLLQIPKYTINRAVTQVNTAQAAIKFVAIGILCLAAYLGYDYHRASQIYLDKAARSARYPSDAPGGALGYAQQSWVYQRQARFAQLMITPVTPQTAAQVLTLALDLVHYSPEPRVIEPLIEAAVMLHFDDVAMYHLARYKAMYPQEYATWSALK
jgi:Virulence factor membrane-bound polymerase, C-terminal/O-Antigen ligase/Protein glycosylation ligase